MRNLVLRATMIGLATAGAASSAHAAEILVNADIAASTTWTNNNFYNLQKQIYVLPGATLTIEPGTVIASDTGIGGSLAVTKGAQIIAKGTKDNPIIFTSKADLATWANDPNHPTGKDPTTGSWRDEACSEWGNLTLMGCGYISEDATAGNVPTCDPNNTATMEGLVFGPSRDSYGGGDDCDDSGCLEYVNLRYGGRVVGVNVELNGLSLGGIGKETDISYVEIMNNVDDGIEIWGGCVTLSYFSIWNIGDDSLDIDQGYRGKAQFGLIVQGYSCDAAQGSGVGDNCCETDGAEDSFWQPVTTTVVYNLTVIGQPLDGDHGTAWRDNARVQYRNSIFMDLGEELVKFDNQDGDGGDGYGASGTLDWPTTWLTPWDQVPPHQNDCPPEIYKAQSSGFLAEIRDSIFFNNNHANAYVEAANRGVFDPQFNNVFEPPNMPICDLQRGNTVMKGGKFMQPVTSLDPRPKFDAECSVDYCKDDDYFRPVKYRGAFAPNMNWLSRWATSVRFGLVPDDETSQWCDAGKADDGDCGEILLSGFGPLSPNSSNTLQICKALPNQLIFLVVGLAELCAPFDGGILYPLPSGNLIFPLVTDNEGKVTLPFTWPSGIPPGFCLYLQALQSGHVCAEGNFAHSNGLKATAQ